MNNQKKVKALFSLSILIIVALFVTVVFQLINIVKIKNNIITQNQQIEQLEQQLDYYQNKEPETNYEEVI